MALRGFPGRRCAVKFESITYSLSIYLISFTVGSMWTSRNALVMYLWRKCPRPETATVRSILSRFRLHSRHSSYSLTLGSAVNRRAGLVEDDDHS